jgi:hypothetical protein
MGLLSLEHNCYDNDHIDPDHEVISCMLPDSREFRTFAGVSKRSVIAVFFICVYTVVLAHSIIPHHHHFGVQTAVQQSLEHAQGKDDHDHDGFAGMFGKYWHPSNQTETYKAAGSNVSVSSMASAYLAVFFILQVKVSDPSPVVRRNICDLIPVSLCCLSPKGLRAPPSR